MRASSLFALLLLLSCSGPSGEEVFAKLSPTAQSRINQTLNEEGLVNLGKYPTDFPYVFPFLYEPVFGAVDSVVITPQKGGAKTLTFNAEGKAVRQTGVRPDNRVELEHTFAYDDAGRPLKKDGYSCFKYFYNEAGHMDSMRTCRPDWSAYSSLSSDTLIYLEYGSKNELRRTTKFLFDDQERMVWRDEVDASGNHTILTWSYDQMDKMLSFSKLASVLASGKKIVLDDKYSYTYKGEWLTRIELHRIGQMDGRETKNEKIIYSYNYQTSPAKGNGKLAVQQTILLNNSGIAQTMNYVFDEQGNWIAMEGTGIKNTSIKRNIFYR